MTEQYKLIYREYGQEIIVVSTDEEPLMTLLRQLMILGPDFDLQFYGKEEVDIGLRPARSNEVDLSEDAIGVFDHD